MECRQDCYWYEEVPDMGARIPFCKLKKGHGPIGHEDCERCENYHSKYEPTKADRIRSMTDEELATWLTACLWGEARDVPFLLSCTVDKWLDWLRQAATE